MKNSVQAYQDARAALAANPESEDAKSAVATSGAAVLEAAATVDIATLPSDAEKAEEKKEEAAAPASDATGAEGEAK